jgi:hypothetical protein
VITAVGFEVAVSCPSALRPMTWTRSLKPESPCRATYVLSLALEILVQSDASGAPAPSQRYQRYS